MGTKEELIEIALQKLGVNSVDESAQLLPSGWTSDILKSEAEKSFFANDYWSCFHHLSGTHGHLIHQRLKQKLNHPSKTDDIASSSSHNVPYAKKFLQCSSVDVTKELIATLPAEWTVVQVTTFANVRRWNQMGDKEDTPSIYVSRIQCGSSPKILIQDVKPNQTCPLQSIVTEVQDITKENKIVVNYSKDDPRTYLQKKEEINNRMKTVVRTMECYWLKWCDWLLTGSLPPREEREIDAILNKVLTQTKVSIDTRQFEMLKLIVGSPYNDTVNGNDRIGLRAAVANLLGMSVRDDAPRQLTAAIQKYDNRIGVIRDCTRNPFILIVDKDIVTLPWEMLSVIQNQPVTRMPSLSSLGLLYNHHSLTPDSVLVKGVEPLKGFYILDPENNLPRTRERIKDTLAETTWKGIIGQKPDADVFCGILTENDICVYVGHGAGNQYIPYQIVESVECHSLVLLYGCSSVALRDRGPVSDPWGTVINYLTALCPCVVGMQWEVMDKDTDLLTNVMLKAMLGKGTPGTLLQDPPTDIALLVAKARPLCAWYMISAALVCYGLPLHVVPT